MKRLATVIPQYGMTLKCLYGIGSIPISWMERGRPAADRIRAPTLCSPTNVASNTIAGAISSIGGFAVPPSYQENWNAPYWIGALPSVGWLAHINAMRICRRCATCLRKIFATFGMCLVLRSRYSETSRSAWMRHSRSGSIRPSPRSRRKPRCRWSNRDGFP